MALEPGQIIDSKYKVIRHIGEGGMGTVYEGENMRIARRVAIKVLHAQVAAMADFVARFEREARAVARIGSQHVCDVLDLGDLPSGDRYIVMEYLDGVSFEDRLLERGKLTPAQLAPIAFELLEGLGTMHVAGVIHRDLKPANIFLSRISGGRGEVVKILDFGVAKLQPLVGEVGSMTQTGTMMGTPLYMSPEQARGARDVDGRTDIYAASVMFYRALTGVLPYNAETLNELLFKIVLEDPKPLRELAPEVDEAFAAMVHKGLARELPQRFQHAREYQEQIAIWGKTQGRSSLSFAVTHHSDRPPNTPITLPDPSRVVASAVSAGPLGGGTAPLPASAAAGTPIAWSESAPHQGSPRLETAATVLTPLSAQAQASPVAGLGTSGPADAAAHPSNRTLSSPSTSDLSTSKPATVEAIAIANAQTGPALPIGDARSGGKSSRAVVFGVVGAAAVAIVAFVAFGRSGPSGAPTSGSAAGSAVATATAGVAEPTAAAAIADVPAAAPLAASAAPLDDAATTTTTPPRKDANGSAAHRLDPVARHGPTAPSAPTAPPTAAPPQPSATTAPAPKPAASVRKFRTNLD